MNVETYMSIDEMINVAEIIQATTESPAGEGDPECEDGRYVMGKFIGSVLNILNTMKEGNLFVEEELPAMMGRGEA